MTDESRLQEALDILDNGEHWGKGAFSDLEADGRTRYCALGAIEAAWGSGQFCFLPASMQRNIDRDNCRLQHAIRSHADSYNQTIPGFNDAPETTWEDVALMFKKAIAET